MKPPAVVLRRPADECPAQLAVCNISRIGAEKRCAALAWTLAASTSRSRGGAFVTRESRSSRAACVTWSTARVKAGSLALEGLAKPLSFRTNCKDEARISSSVAGGLKLCRTLIFRHIKNPFLHLTSNDDMAPPVPVQWETSSLIMKNFLRVARPKFVVSATSAASRPTAITIRPMRATLCRASKVYQRPPR